MEDGARARHVAPRCGAAVARRQAVADVDGPMGKSDSARGGTAYLVEPRIPRLGARAELQLLHEVSRHWPSLVTSTNSSIQADQSELNALTSRAELMNSQDRATGKHRRRGYHRWPTAPSQADPRANVDILPAGEAQVRRNRA